MDGLVLLLFGLGVLQWWEEKSETLAKGCPSGLGMEE